MVSLVFVVVCDAQGGVIFLMLASRPLLRQGVGLACERSFLVRFGCVPVVVFLGFLYVYAQSHDSPWRSSVFFFLEGRLAARCPAFHEMWGRWSCSMSRDVAMKSVTMCVHDILHGADVQGCFHACALCSLRLCELEQRRLSFVCLGDSFCPMVPGAHALFVNAPVCKCVAGQMLSLCCFHVCVRVFALAFVACVRSPKIVYVFLMIYPV